MRSFKTKYCLQSLTSIAQLLVPSRCCSHGNFGHFSSGTAPFQWFLLRFMLFPRNSVYNLRRCHHSLFSLTLTRAIALVSILPFILTLHGIQLPIHTSTPQKSPQSDPIPPIHTRISLSHPTQMFHQHHHVWVTNLNFIHVNCRQTKTRPGK